jgi:hypothetical protein
VRGATPVSLGFLGASRSRRETPIHRDWISLDFLGFPWILSSESRLINGLRGSFRNEFSQRLVPSRSRRGDGEPTGPGTGNAQDCSSGKLNSSSDYPQAIVGFSRLGLNPNTCMGADRSGRTAVLPEATPIHAISAAERTLPAAQDFSFFLGPYRAADAQQSWSDASITAPIRSELRGAGDDDECDGASNR